MHAERPVDIRRVDLKAVSLLMIQMLMLLHAGFMMLDYLAIKEDDRLINLDDMDFPLVLIPIVISAISVIFVTVVLLVYKPNMDNDSLATDLAFCILYATVDAAYNLVWFYVRPTAPVHKWLVFDFNLVVLYTMGCFWKKLNTHYRVLGERD